ncbi:MAG: M48 family metalloprotease [Fimbriimonas sp.]|nr:M48 family metalloprotease [Fimbriimonas sp.]
MRRLWAVSIATLAVMVTLLITMATLAEMTLHLRPGFMALTVEICLCFVLIQFVLSPYLIRAMLKIGWGDPSEVSPEFGEWYRQSGAALGIGCPTFGIIESGMPNAFTFGRFVKDARVVVTRGLIDALDEEELRAVVAHEFGHIRNRDFLAMTIVQAVVLLIYSVARMMLNNSNMHVKAAGAVSYAIYWVAQLGALAFSRIREFMADRVSAETVHAPDALASALVKIGYGLASVRYGDKPAVEETVKEKKKAQHRQTAGVAALGALGIANLASFQSVVGWGGTDGRPTDEAFAVVSAWDLKNAWARYSEIWSTHPLIARRVSKLMSLPESRRRYNVGGFERPNWRRFFYEWVIYAFPTVAMIAAWLAMLSGEVVNPWLLSGGFAALFAALIVRMFLVYPRKDFRETTVLALLGDTEASHVSPIPCVLRGKFVTRAEGGLWWSANLVFQDDTGIVVAQRKLYLPAWMTLWGWIRSKAFVGAQDIVLTGWYRRYSHPTVEIDRIDCESTGEHFKSPYWIRGVVSLVVLFAISATIFAGLVLK